jgi:endonuclease/exonuclease/phosphatase family metal-dependent hydrolase
MRRLRVLTLNIWNRQGPWEARLAMIREGIRQLAPDVVGLQEVLSFEGRSQADDIREGLGYEAALGCAHDLGGGVLLGNAVLSRWPVRATEVFPLPNCGTEEQRSLLFAELDAPFGALPFFVTHLNWKFHEGYVREQQVVAIAAHVAARASTSGFPAVLTGDFNAQPEATEVRFLKGLHSLAGTSTFFSDVFEMAGQGRGVTFDPTRNPHAAGLFEHPRRIDYVFVRGPDHVGRGRPLDARVVLDEVKGGVAPSDHFGVLAEVAIDARAPAA